MTQASKEPGDLGVLGLYRGTPISYEFPLPSGDVPVSLTQNPPCFTLHYMMALVRDFTIAIEAVDGGFDEAATAIAFLVEPHQACHTKSLEKGRVV